MRSNGEVKAGAIDAIINELHFEADISNSSNPPGAPTDNHRQNTYNDKN